MAEWGLVRVGHRAVQLPADELGVPVVDVRLDATAAREATPEAVAAAASRTFSGPDADRWRLVAPDRIAQDTGVLWATVQVTDVDLGRETAGFSGVLVVAWVDEAGLPAAVRRLAAEGRRVCVLLGGDPRPLDAARVDANHTVLAQLLRDGDVVRVWTTPDPGPVLAVALELATSAEPLPIGEPREVDPGPWLELPPDPIVGAPPVAFEALVHIELGRADGLPRLACLVAAWRALKDLCEAEPSLLEGIDDDPRLVRDRLARIDVPAWIDERLRARLDDVRLQGSEPLVDQIERRLRPVADDVERLLDVIGDAERARLSPLRRFSARGIDVTVDALQAALDRTDQGYPSDRLRALALLLEGLPEGLEDEDKVPLTAWRSTFAGLPSRVQGFSTAGRSIARRWVRQRFDAFRSAYARDIADHLRVLVARARDPDAPASTVELRQLVRRAERVQEALGQVLGVLRDRITAESVSALRADRLVRWACPDPQMLFLRLLGRLSAFPVADEVHSRLDTVLSELPVGRLDDAQVEPALRALMRRVVALPGEVERAPSHDAVLVALLHDEDPARLRSSLVPDPRLAVELRLPDAPEPELQRWLAEAGMSVTVVPARPPCLFTRRVDPKVGARHGPRKRRACTEHRLRDLMLPGPDGDDVARITGTVQASVALLLGLVLGVLHLDRVEGSSVSRVESRGLGLPPTVVLPIEVVHVIAQDPALLERLQERIDDHLARLPGTSGAHAVLRQLVELASLGPSAAVCDALGLTGRLASLAEGSVRALLQRHADRAVASMVDVLHTTELQAWVRRPTRRTLLDLDLLGSA